MNFRYRTLAAVLLIAQFSIAAPPSDEGRTIFTSRCAGCHNVNRVLTGPALAGIDERRSMEWIVSFINSSQTLVKNGDKEAIALFEKFNRIPMPDHPDLTADNIRSIIAFIKSESKTAETVPFGKPGKIRPDYTPVSITDYRFFGLYAGLVLLLAAALLLYVNVKAAQRKAKNES